METGGIAKLTGDRKLSKRASTDVSSLMTAHEITNNKILECEEKLRKLKERCDKLTDELDALYAEKKELEAKELLEAIAKSSKTRTEILAFLESV